ncbi:hypothetical protein AALP_AA5G187200 [Arabis alpina]|uniref:Uncharacterized protein n=1 Tax=Arabis alpina TaxID=50452 RepID=A0A087GXY9_ARAAL|nr:hypothetical protein AALP_AA5G187200 [Arabis alpina]
MGVKAAKDKGKRRGEGDSEGTHGRLFGGIKEMWVIKKEHFAVKERLSNKKILECLLAKPEPLTQIELTLKNKLMMEMSNDLGQTQ